MKLDRKEILKALETITIAGEGKNMVESGAVQNVITFGDEVVVDLLLSTPALHIKKRAEVDIIKVIHEKVYEKAKAQEDLPDDQIVNVVKEIYRPFTADEISAKISELLTPAGINAEVEIVYQSIEGLHTACPGHTGDWYFSGDYPTPGGNRVVNRAFMNYVEGKNVRAY
jgi:hypothetical protein